jgi:AraC-like DNA-binding protein
MGEGASVSTTDLSRVRTRLATTNREEAQASMQKAYGVTRVLAAGPPGRFFHSNITEGVDRFSITRLRNTDHLDVDTSPLGFVMVGKVLSGRYLAESRSARLDTSSGRPFLYPCDEVIHGAGTPLDLGLVNLDLAYVQSVAGLGDRPLEFYGTRPVSDGAARRWGETVNRMLDDVIRTDGALDNILLRDASSREMARMLLRTFASNALDPMLESGETAAFAAVRRALEFIETNAAQPITLDEIAAAARLSPRGVQAAFQRHLGRSPMEHLRRIRLDAVHQELRAADPFAGVTVAAVAQRWGFSHLGRFAAAYRAQYGAPPRQTLDS